LTKKYGQKGTLVIILKSSVQRSGLQNVSAKVSRRILSSFTLSILIKLIAVDH